MDLKTGRAKNTSFIGMLKQIVEKLTALCCNTEAAVSPKVVGYVSDSGSHPINGSFAIYCIEDTVFDILTMDNLQLLNTGPGGLITTKTFVAGTTIYGEFDRINLNSGSILVYFK